MVIGLWLLIREMGDRWWPATLFLLVPRWPLLLPALVLAPMAYKSKNWWLTGAVLCATSTILIALMGFRAAVPTSAPGRGELRLMSFNVHRQHVDAEALARYIATVNPDVIALQDWSSAESEPLFSTGGWNVHREGELLVASHFPIGKVTPLEFGDGGDASKAERGTAACFELLLPSGAINLINVHLASPHSGLLTVIPDRGQTLQHNADKRWHESEMVRDLVDRTPEPIIVAGDFNTTDDSPILRQHWADFTDAFAERGYGFGYTYLVAHTQLRIDHILSSQAWRPIHCWVGPEAGSPHRPLVADFVFR